METAPLEHVMDHTRTSPDFMDSSSFGNYDALSGLDYLQYPHSPFGVSAMGREFAHHRDCLSDTDSARQCLRPVARPALGSTR